MGPGALSLEGFLGDDPLGLDRIEADAQVLARAGVSAEDIAKVLHDLWERARTSMGAAPLAGVDVEVEEARGRIPCPFGHPGVYGKGVATIEFAGRTVRVSPLSIHMIRAHGFFGGRGSPFRIEPQDAVELVERYAAGS